MADGRIPQLAEPDTSDSPSTSTGGLFPNTLKPEIPRRATDPDFPRSASPNLPSNPRLPGRRERNRSPFSRSHLRSKSAASLLTPPAMTRAHSMPAADPSGRMLMSTSSQPRRPASPLSSTGGRYRSPNRRVSEEAASLGVPSLPDIGENVALDPETENTPRAYDSNSSIGSSPYHTFPRRYRPSSPLRSLPAPTSFPSTSSTTAPPRTPSSPSSSSSPLMSAQKFNEPYPVPTNYSLSFLSTSSIPSTPTSLRSRSPSISSLETIPDSPDAEEAAIEADTMARLRVAVESETDEDSDSGSETRRRGSAIEASGGNRGGGFGFSTSQKKKRWSVCGAERRGDLDLETIWED